MGKYTVRAVNVEVVRGKEAERVEGEGDFATRDGAREEVDGEAASVHGGGGEREVGEKGKVRRRRGDK